ncbi:MAG: hypothetical protein Ct9H300mP2_1960 [Candidatus Neomarinimicrobiota bacterium]|nr:MAG: hypothetical protein Ct9H300mP2_1960 [Candidatus Neomarinimicrobiota bacterium]
MNDVDSARVVDIDPARIANVTETPINKHTVHGEINNLTPLVGLDPERNVIGASPLRNINSMIILNILHHTLP